MTTYYDFVPSNSKAPTFMPTFDGEQYNITITWNISARRYYVNGFQLDGTLLFSVPMCDTLPALAIQSLIWDEQNSRVVGTVVDPFIFNVGSVIMGNIVNCMPVSYNGSGFISILNTTQFWYPMMTNPGECDYCGAIEYLIDLTKPYFNSTLVYRQGAFEVTP